MIDIFMESLLGALVAFGSVITIEPGAGALAFCAVVILTMFAAETFDPRLMWDAAVRRCAPIRGSLPAIEGSAGTYRQSLPGFCRNWIVRTRFSEQARHMTALRLSGDGLAPRVVRRNAGQPRVSIW